MSATAPNHPPAAQFHSRNITQHVETEFVLLIRCVTAAQQLCFETLLLGAIMGVEMSKTRTAVQILLGVLVLAGGALVTSDKAEARMCFRTECVVRAPFVCKGPIGSCGFAQGRCLRSKRVAFFVPGRSCAGSPPVVR